MLSEFSLYCYSCSKSKIENPGLVDWEFYDFHGLPPVFLKNVMEK